MKCRLCGTVILSYKNARICGSLVKVNAKNATPIPSTIAMPKSIPQTLQVVFVLAVILDCLLKIDGFSVTQRCVPFVKNT